MGGAVSGVIEVVVSGVLLLQAASRQRQKKKIKVCFIIRYQLVCKCTLRKAEIRQGILKKYRVGILKFSGKVFISHCLSLRPPSLPLNFSLRTLGVFLSPVRIVLSVNPVLFIHENQPFLVKLFNQATLLLISLSQFYSTTSN